MARAARVSTQVTGMRELRSRLRHVEGGLEDLKTVNRRAAEIVGTAAMGAAPIRTGNLAATEREGATRRSGIVRFGNGTTVPYACPIHWGWLTRPNPARHWRGGPIRANPFASRAAQRTESLWTRLYRAFVVENWNRT